MHKKCKRKELMAVAQETAKMDRIKQKKTYYASGKKNASFFRDVKKRRWWLPIVIVLLVIVLVLGIGVAVLRDASRVVLTKVTVAHEQVPESFNGYKILHISDILGRDFNQKRLAQMEKLLQGVEYDIVIFTGDFVKEQDETDFWFMRDFMTLIDPEKPIYYVVGDTDYHPTNVAEDSDSWKICIKPAKKTAFMEFFEEEYGAKMIYPAQKIESEAGEYIFLTGVQYDKDVLNAMDFDQDKDFSICVTHKPINYNVTRRLKDANKRTLTEVDYDLSISGDTLGGQYRLPILGAVYSVGYGFFPDEDDVYGLSEDDAGRFNYITAGLGVKDGIRVFSTPEISLIELQKAEPEPEDD